MNIDVIYIKQDGEEVSEDEAYRLIRDNTKVFRVTSHGAVHEMIAHLTHYRNPVMEEVKGSGRYHVIDVAIGLGFDVNINMNDEQLKSLMGAMANSREMWYSDEKHDQVMDLIYFEGGFDANQLKFLKFFIAYIERKARRQVETDISIVLGNYFDRPV